MPGNPKLKGTAMVEVALVITVFFMLLLGLFELGRSVWVYTTVAHAARQGARYAMVHGAANPASDIQIQSAVTTHAVGLIAGDLTVTTSWLPDNQRGSLVEVKVAYPLKLIISPFILNSGTLQLGNTARAVVAQ